ncbi:HEAT domain-containing protein, partial [Oryctes borbonicus]
QSYTLRLSVINVITEVVLTSFSKTDLSNNERESRDEFLEILFDHMLDVSSYVRARVIQNWSRLQQEDVLPAKMQSEILEKVVEHLTDKASNVRKAAAICVRSFLEHNPFGSELKLKKMEEALAKESKSYEEMMEKHCEPHIEKLKESQEVWNNIKDEIAKVIENNLNQNDDNDEEENDLNVPTDQIPSVVQTYLKEKKYEEAVKITKHAVEYVKECSHLRNTMEHVDERELLMKVIRNFHLNIFNQLLSLTNREDGAHLSKQQELVDYYGDAVKFLKVLESAIEPMRDLLDSVNISEMQEAVEFFVATYKFNIDNAR